MTNDTQSYNIAAIRELLLAAFTAEELRRFCAETGIRSKTKLLADIRAAKKRVGDEWLAPDGESRPDGVRPDQGQRNAEKNQ